MKRLTKEEFEDRMLALHRAKRIFIESGLTNSITRAFEIYQEVFAERERQLQVTRMTDGGDIYELPDCPDCGDKMRIIGAPPGVVGEINSRLACQNQKCGATFDSPYTLEQWRERLKIREPESI